MKNELAFAFFVSSAAIFFSTGVSSADLKVSGATESPQVSFSVEELKTVCSELAVGDSDISVLFEQNSSLEKQAYRIEVTKPRTFTISGGNPVGLMYGGLRLAESIQLSRNIERVRSESGSPYLAYRALKMNIPLDARTPSYDDTGDSALWNIDTMWDLTFWQAQFDAMARHRYNALTLWNPHPFPSLIKIKEFPDVALNDVYTTSYRYPLGKGPRKVAPEVLENLVLLKKISIDEKITFWRQVMALAKNRGIEIFFITWNVHLDGAYGKYGIDQSPDNATTIEYMRASTRELFLTYPDLAGIGVTAGEMMEAFHTPENKEQWLWNTYGRGVQDAVAEQPEREIRFIHRDWQTGLDPVLEAFADYPGPFDLSYKYAKARIHSMPDPVFADPLIIELQKHRLKSWWNLRNDDLYTLRWGDPAYTQAMIKNMPPEQTIGFHMGSDGYVWARNYALNDPQQRGQMEIDRHWYNFMQWGRLGYDPSLDRRFFESRLRHHYPEADPVLLYETWATSSKIMPQINRFFFKRGDWMFSPEGCHYMRGFLTVEDFIESEPMQGATEISISDFLTLSDQKSPGQVITPLEVSDNLDTFSKYSLEGAKKLRDSVEGISSELDSVLTDIESMAWLGHYYADKIRGATRLAQFRQSGDPVHKKAAVDALKNAVEKWQHYADLASSQYRVQVLARGLLLDLHKIAEDVRAEFERVAHTKNK